ncbi:hypothetical protein LF1_27750 [Rubripirellula obstinata]|uniref:Uncharacterized protein n=1 Tax=Rubripirellula obstinata TaxID=406547 RepID=A0A5B1CI48_9BACT|nr:hypothetical protein LF1_27750 [Rubripirellula obstinata]
MDHENIKKRELSHRSGRVSLAERKPALERQETGASHGVRLWFRDRCFARGQTRVSGFGDKRFSIRFTRFLIAGFDSINFLARSTISDELSGCLSPNRTDCGFRGQAPAGAARCNVDTGRSQRREEFWSRKTRVSSFSRVGIAPRVRCRTTRGAMPGLIKSLQRSKLGKLHHGRQHKLQRCEALWQRHISLIASM